MKQYKIEEVEQQLNITKRTLRYYDRFGFLEKKEDKGARYFDDKDLMIINKIRSMQQNQFISLDKINPVSKK